MSRNPNQPQLPGSEKQATTSQGPSPKERLKSCLETASGFFKSVPTEGEGRIWLDLLNLCSAGEIEEAFRKWHFKKWGDQWPRMPQPGEILEMVGYDRANVKNQDAPWGCENCAEGWIPFVGFYTTKSRTTYSDVKMVRPCECQANAGLRTANRTPDSGYGENDVKWIVARRAMAITFEDAEKKIVKRWSIAEWEELFNELDEKRAGGAPEWRKETEGQQFLRAV